MANAPLRNLLAGDPLLRQYEKILSRRITNIIEKEKTLTQRKMDLAEFAQGHEFFGLHFCGNQWIFREWAPNAGAVYLVGDMTDWQEKKGFSLERTDEEGVWEIRLPSSSLEHGDLYRLRVHWPGGQGDRIPA